MFNIVSSRPVWSLLASTSKAKCPRSISFRKPTNPSSGSLVFNFTSFRKFHDSRKLFEARRKKYVPKYQIAEEKSAAIVPSRLLDPQLERKLPPLHRRDLAFDESESITSPFEAFDVDLETRELDFDSIDDKQLEEMILAQQAHETQMTDDYEAQMPSDLYKVKENKKKRTMPTVKPHPLHAESSKTEKDAAIVPPSETASAPSSTEEYRPDAARKPIVAIVGRPNVGKSTLFNRLIRKSRSLITPIAGTTRDRKYGVSSWSDYDIMFIDTGGMLGGDTGDPWAESITEQAMVAIEEADTIVMLVDQVDGITENDRILARMLRKTSKPVLLAVNKCDNHDRIESSKTASFVQLGLGEPHPLSASHGLGTAELLDAILKPIRALGFQAKARGVDDDMVATYPLTPDKMVLSSAFNADGTRKNIRVAVVGVPNVGKSSLLNQILGSKRSVVSDRPGTTTDPIDENIMWKGAYPITIVDTAGVRRKKSQEGFVEKLSALWSLKCIEASHISILLLDAEKGAEAQDVRLSSYIIDNYRSCIVVVNKWDLAPDRSIMGMQAYEEQLRERLQFWYYVPVVFASAKTGFNVDSIMAWVIRVSDERRIHLVTRKLFQIIEQASMIKLPPSSGKRRVRFRYCTQVNLGGSPTFVFFVNHPDLIDAPYRRFLEGFIRQNFAFTGTPVRLMFRQNVGRTIAERDKRKQSQEAATKSGSDKVAKSKKSESKREGKDKKGHNSSANKVKKNQKS